MIPDSIAEFRQAMAAAGIPYSGSILGDGHLHRFDADGSKGHAEYYALHLDSHPAGSFGSHRLGIEGSWRASPNGTMKPADLVEFRKQWRAEEIKREQERASRQATAAAKCQELVAAAAPASPEHPYLKLKSVPVLGNLRQRTDGDLVLPLVDETGKVQSVQTIDAEGDKLFWPGARAQGVFFWLVDRTDGPLIVAEGYATAATCHLATGWAAVSALNCGNLKAVCASLKKKFPSRPLIIAADDDRFTPSNPGHSKAKEAADQFKPPLPIAIPVFSDQNTTGTDFNDLAASDGLAAVRTILEASVSIGLSFHAPDHIIGMSLPAEDVILGDHILCQGGLTAILAAGGVGKSRVVEQLCAAICARHSKFLAWDIHPRSKPLRWLIVQAENSTRRLQIDLGKIRDWINPTGQSPNAWEDFCRNVRILNPVTEADSLLDLDNPTNVSRLQQAVDLFLPDVVVFDALYNFSLRELRYGADMLAAIHNCTRVARLRNPFRSVILLHHALTGATGGSKSTGYDRASFARDSKVFHQLARSVVNIAPISQDNNDQLLFSCGKCSDGKEFLPFVVRLNPDSLIYECDPSVDALAAAETLRTTNRKQPLMDPHRVRELCSTAGSSKADLSSAIRDDCGCTRESSYRFIRKSVLAKTIRPGANGNLFRF